MADFIATDYEKKFIRIDAKTVGIVSGTFAPFHAGHKRIIEQSFLNDDLTIIIVGGHESDRGHEYGFPQKLRYQRLRCAFEGQPNVMVAMLDEKKTYEFSDPEGLAAYHDGVMKIVNVYAPNAEHIRNYVGQKDYHEIVSAAYEDFENILVERDDCDGDIAVNAADASATIIRSKPFEHWDMIDDAFKFRYRKTYVFAGAMSTGKSTITEIVNDILSRNKQVMSEYEITDDVLNMLPKGSYLVDELARRYTEGWRHTIESDLDERDYLAFIDWQLTMMENAKMAVGDAQACVIDTDGVMTRRYILRNEEAISNDMVAPLAKISEISCNWTRDNADIVFVLPNDVTFEMDGSRDGHTENTRDEYRKELIDDYNKLCNGRVILVNEGTLQSKIRQIISTIAYDMNKKTQHWICDGYYE